MHRGKDLHHLNSEVKKFKRTNYHILSSVVDQDPNQHICIESESGTNSNVFDIKIHIILARHPFRDKIIYFSKNLRVTNNFFDVEIDMLNWGPRRWQNPFWVLPMPRPLFCYSEGIMVPVPICVTPPPPPP
jgi:hypothetical protein